MKVTETGWYHPVSDEDGDGLEFVGCDNAGVIKWMSEEDLLDECLITWAKEYYDFEDFLECALDGGAYADRNSMIPDFIENQLEQETEVYLDEYGCDSIVCLGRGDDVDYSYNFIIDSQGNKILDEDDEDEDDEDEEEDEEEED